MLGSFVRIDSNMGNFGRSVRTPRNNQLARFDASHDERILNDDSCQEIGRVCELVFGTNVACCKDVVVRRSQSIVHFNATLRVRGNIDLFQAKTVQVWRTPNSQKDLVTENAKLAAIL